MKGSPNRGPFFVLLPPVGPFATFGNMEKFTYKGVRFLPNAIRYIEADPTRLDTIKAAIDRMDERERPYSYVSAGESSFCIVDY